MRKFLHTGRAIFKLTHNKPFTCLNYDPICFLSTQINKAVTHNLKVEREENSIWKSTLPNIMLNREIKTIEDWKSIRDELFKAGKAVTPVNIDYFILRFCIVQQNYGLAYSYMEFLKKENLKPNLSTIGSYFKLFYLTNHDKVVEESKELNILTLYKELRKTYKLLDASTCENVIHALSITENWKECLKLLEEIKISNNPASGVYSVISAAAFKNSENDLAWKLLDEMISYNQSPHSVVYLSYLQQCEKIVSTDNCLNAVEKLFEFFRLHDIKCNKEVAEKINDLYRKRKINSNITVVDDRGVCHKCKEKLHKFELNQQEFENLKNAVFKNVIIGKDVFCRTTPVELRRFQDFVANMKKYDVVIDGLNVAYLAGVKQSPKIFSSLVASVVNHFATQKKNILVLGRTHMERWPKWSYIIQNADTFLAQTLSQDDPYLLYCALNSGLNTIVVSKDLMRGHLFRLQDFRLKVLFRQWLRQNQYQIKFVNNQGKVFFKYPLPYMQTAQKQQNHWHIPFEENEDANEMKWLCLSI